jgi:hypothetical protein
MRRLPLLCLLLAPSWVFADAPATPPAAPREPLPQSVWRVGSGDGLEHLQSGLVCPSTVGRYHRLSARIYDNFGLDVSCGYGAGTTIVTLYVTRRTDGDLAAAMAEAKREFLQVGAARNPRLVSETSSASAGVEWTTALYAVDGGFNSSIWIADLSGWTLELRITNIVADEARIASDAGLFSTAAKQSAGVRLAMCAAQAAPRRDGKGIADSKNLEESVLISSLVGAAAIDEAAKGKAKPAPADPGVWCVEAPQSRGDQRFLAWRGVGEGPAGGVDRFTAMTVGPPAALTIAPDDMANLIRAESRKKGAAPAPRWIASTGGENNYVIWGYFDGRPPLDTGADLFGAILSGAAKPLGGYDVKGKNINITVPPGR